MHFINTHKMLQYLHGGGPIVHGPNELRARWRPEQPVLDDFRLKPLVDPAPANIYDAINERFEIGSMLVTSNRAPVEWPDLFGNSLLASAGLDRLAHHAKPLVITGHSSQPQGRQPSEKTTIDSAKEKK